MMKTMVKLGVIVSAVFLSMLCAVMAQAAETVREKLARAIQMTEEQARDKVTHRLLEAIGSGLTYEQGRAIQEIAEQIQDFALQTTQKAREALEADDLDAAFKWLEPAQLALRIRTELHKALLRGVEEDIERGLEEMRRFLRKSRPEI